MKEVKIVIIIYNIIIGIIERMFGIIKHIFGILSKTWRGATMEPFPEYFKVCLALSNIKYFFQLISIHILHLYDEQDIMNWMEKYEYYLYFEEDIFMPLFDEDKVYNILILILIFFKSDVFEDIIQEDENSKINQLLKLKLKNYEYEIENNLNCTLVEDGNLLFLIFLFNLIN